MQKNIILNYDEVEDGGYVYVTADEETDKFWDPVAKSGGGLTANEDSAGIDLSYVRQIAVLGAGSQTEELKNLARGLYRYNMAANEYFT